MNKEQLAEQIKTTFPEGIESINEKSDWLTIEVSKNHFKNVCKSLRDDEPFLMNQLIDVCGVDYQDYGLSEWHTEETTETGFSRGKNVVEKIREVDWNKPRFAAVYHLLSIPNNHRIRIRVFLDESDMTVPSVVDLWPAANWFEREAFDLFGIIFDGHPDLRRILTDYGFVGHPFRKDFPLIGEVSMRYDAQQQRCVYEPVVINPRVLVPKVIRKDTRYTHFEEEELNV